MEHLVQPTLDFISAHSGWAFPIMFITSFGELFAFIGLFFPGTSILIVAGTLMSAGSLPFWPIMAGAVTGAVLGELGLVLARLPLWRRDRAGLAVHAQPGPPGERHRVF